MLDARSHQVAAARAAVIGGELRGAALVAAIRAVPPAAREAWVDAVLGIAAAPPDQADLPTGAVPYLPCPVDEVLAALAAAPVAAADRFVDVGAGLGRVVVLAHLVTGARAHGVELQGQLGARARATIAALGLDPAVVDVVDGDAATADLDGSVAFLYAPCNGALLRRVLARLALVARRRALTVCAVDCVLPELPWLTPRAPSTLALTVYDAAVP
ncbi:MAG: hypothetical protein R3B06_22735 [Kofleriaceae bacterium]